MGAVDALPNFRQTRQNIEAMLIGRQRAKRL